MNFLTIRDRTHDGRPLKLLVVVDEYSRECLAIEVQRRLTSQSVQEVLGLFFLHGKFVLPVKLLKTRTNSESSSDNQRPIACSWSVPASFG